jgi:hypothetical protein
MVAPLLPWRFDGAGVKPRPFFVSGSITPDGCWIRPSCARFLTGSISPDSISRNRVVVDVNEYMNNSYNCIQIVKCTKNGKYIIAKY